MDRQERKNINRVGYRVAVQLNINGVGYRVAAQLKIHVFSAFQQENEWTNKNSTVIFSRILCLHSDHSCIIVLSMLTILTQSTSISAKS